MAALTAALLALSAANTASSYMGDRRNADIAQQQGNAQGSLFDTNAKYADSLAADATQRGIFAEDRVRSAMRQTGGAQRAAAAAAGLSPDAGSARDVFQNDQMLGELDALTVRNNAAREAYGFTVQASNDRTQGAWARASGNNEAAALRSRASSTLLSGAADLASIYAQSPKGVGNAPLPSRGPTMAPPTAPRYGGRGSF